MKVADTIRCRGFGPQAGVCANARGNQTQSSKPLDEKELKLADGMHLCGKCYRLREEHKRKMWMFGTEIPKK